LSTVKPNIKATIVGRYGDARVGYWFVSIELIAQAKTVAKSTPKKTNLKLSISFVVNL